MAIISMIWRGKIGSKTFHEANGWVDTQEPTYASIACGLSFEILTMTNLTKDSHKSFSMGRN